MYAYTDNYKDIIDWQNDKTINVEELERDYETYSSLDELIYDVKQNIRDILYLNEGFLIGGIFYAAEIDDITGKFIQEYTFQIKIDIKEITREEI